MTDDPEALTQFIFRCRNRGVRVEELLDLFEFLSYQPQGASPRLNGGVSNGVSSNQKPGASALRLIHSKYALLLALGEYPLSEIPESRRDPLLKQLADTYRNDPSSGVHGAAGWLLRQWGQTDVVREVDHTAIPYSTDREWFTLAITVTPTSAPAPRKEPAEDNADKETNDEQTTESDETKKADVENAKSEPLPKKIFYYTFVVFPAGESTIGSVSDEPDRQKDEDLHRVTLTRPFAILDREITMEELIDFKPLYSIYKTQFDAKPSDAGFAADWYDSVAFCRWLGTQSGIVEEGQSYASPESLSKEDYPREPNPSANWAPLYWPMRLGQPGFRLPTESEWEVASRASVRTAYGFGSEASLLGRFGFQENSSKHVHPPREFRPSLRGLFDMHGNLYEWTHDWHGEYEGTAVVDPIISERGGYRVIRGGSWSDVAAICRTAHRNMMAPSIRTANGGFRVALSPSVKWPEAEQGAKPLRVGTE